MALKINTTIETQEGFTTDKAIVFLDIFLVQGPQYVNMMYFSSLEAFQSGKPPITPANIATQVFFKMAPATFWGDQLATDIHDICKAEIEKVTGPNTVAIIEDPAA